MREYKMLSDDDKLGLLQLLYSDLKGKKLTARDIEQKELIVQEAQLIYNRIKKRGLI